MLSPSPLPPLPNLVVKNGSNTRDKLAAGIPLPSSCTVISTWVAPRCVAEMVILPSEDASKACSSALLTRLVSTWPKRARKAFQHNAFFDRALNRMMGHADGWPHG